LLYGKRWPSPDERGGTRGKPLTGTVPRPGNEEWEPVLGGRMMGARLISGTGGTLAV